MTFVFRTPSTARRRCGPHPKTSGAQPSLVYQAISLLRWSAFGFRHWSLAASPLALETSGRPWYPRRHCQDRLVGSVQRVADCLEQVSMGPRGDHGDPGIHGYSFSPLHGTAGSAHRGTPVEACHLDAEGRAVAVCRRPAARIAASVRRPPRGCPNGPRPAGRA